MNMNNNMNNNMMINNQFMVHPNSEMIINLLNQNNEMMNQIAINNNMIIQMMNNPMSNNTNNIINNNIQFNNNIDILPRKNDYLNSEDYFPGNKNIRCNIHFKLNSGKKIISTPKDIKVKDLLLTFAKIIKIKENLLGNKVFFLFNGCKINIKEEKNIIDFGLEEGSTIIVLVSAELMGGNNENEK